ncbi:MAG: hypothetical protein AAF556_09470 [Pseudomonadota bacterium]
MTKPARPQIGMIHSLARSGATIMARQIAAMDQIALYSEVHPLGPPLVGGTVPPDTFIFNLRVQAGVWFQLYAEHEAKAIFAKAQEPNDEAVLRDVMGRTLAAGRYPVLRDWSHMDFLGAPFTEPTNQPVLLEMAARYFTVRRAGLIRHPMANYASLFGLENMVAPYSGVDGFNRFIAGMDRFVGAMDDVPFFRYEDFVTDRQTLVLDLAAALGAPFDADFEAKAERYHFITGDVAGIGNRRLARQTRTVSRNIWAAAQEHPVYNQLLHRFGYPTDQLPQGLQITD